MDKDRYAMEIINNILSGQGGRLFLELRDKQSLAYTVTSNIILGIETGLFTTYIGTEPKKTHQAIDSMFKELELIRTTAVSDDELDRAKNYIVGNQDIENQKNGAIAMQMALNELYGMGIKEWYVYAQNIRAVTKNDILRVAKKYIDLKHHVMSIVGPKDA